MEHNSRAGPRARTRQRAFGHSTQRDSVVASVAKSVLTPTRSSSSSSSSSSSESAVVVLSALWAKVVQSPAKWQVLGCAIPRPGSRVEVRSDRHSSRGRELFICWTFQRAAACPVALSPHALHSPSRPAVLRRRRRSLFLTQERPNYGVCSLLQSCWCCAVAPNKEKSRLHFRVAGVELRFDIEAHVHLTWLY